ncbi:MAG: hypothetical protein COW32_10070 [Candidatus Aquicultor secundus]|uniref:Peptidase A2 domain-containing protein n=1 Tax=Candidatus Aquicultor secundus TaxID=1973895 RepID=A0A2M7T4T7_9ACTN|nr:retropepsin-like aspartic protease [Candidatus Aquicultor secundus]NCO65866.1 retroviral-like aspartic protease [Solirubrobacter sp.]OIO87998.1 MAG: hypothetical protein AUK32_02445 [Candidatus Aquicultor secundus]PIU27787.1 MAG: hypothetical protein COT10_01645 [Candidatus Aquicultor secundus]PIW21411.1 MAG: hypothetical protein COW32_10070 [Candidatus Aquicultor secundus]PIX51505.1 MAG: hypothetical protein COZ51_09290 [Candidatus Aquicultor secundus]
MWYDYEFMGVGSGFIHGPLVDFEILAPEQKPFATMGLVDSGAHTSLLDIAIAKHLKLPVQRKENLVEGSAADGKSIKVYRYPVRVRFSSVIFELDARWTRLSDPKTKVVLGSNLLGRADFFKHFKIMFDQQNERFWIKINPKKKP